MVTWLNRMDALRSAFQSLASRAREELQASARPSAAMDIKQRQKPATTETRPQGMAAQAAVTGSNRDGIAQAERFARNSQFAPTRLGEKIVIPHQKKQIAGKVHASREPSSSRLHLHWEEVKQPPKEQARSNAPSRRKGIAVNAGSASVRAALELKSVME